VPVCRTRLALIGASLALLATGCTPTPLYEVALKPEAHVGDKVEGRAWFLGIEAGFVVLSTSDGAVVWGSQDRDGQWVRDLRERGALQGSIHLSLAELGLGPIATDDLPEDMIVAASANIVAQLAELDAGGAKGSGGARWGEAVWFDVRGSVTRTATIRRSFEGADRVVAVVENEGEPWAWGWAPLEPWLLGIQDEVSRGAEEREARERLRALINPDCYAETPLLCDTSRLDLLEQLVDPLDTALIVASGRPGGCRTAQFFKTDGLPFLGIYVETSRRGCDETPHDLDALRTLGTAADEHFASVDSATRDAIMPAGSRVQVTAGMGDEVQFELGELARAAAEARQFAPKPVKTTTTFEAADPALRRTLGRYTGRVAACFDRRSRDDVRRAVVDVNLAGSGRLQVSDVTTDPVTEKDLAACVQTALAKVGVEGDGDRRVRWTIEAQDPE
jgi:hypothetical protein